jgi:hypothetical protein
MKAICRMNRAALQSLSSGQAKALSMTAQQVLNETRNDKVLPMDTGSLQNESTFVDDSKATKGEVSIVTDTPYARRLYFHPEYNFNTSKNANAQGEWWEEWLTGTKKSRAMKLFKQFYKRVTGGYVR